MDKISTFCKRSPICRRLLSSQHKHLYNSFIINHHHHHAPMEEQPPPKGTIVFTTVGRPFYGFDIFSTTLQDHHPSTERLLTDGVSINYNGHFSDQNTLVYVSERTGSAQVHSNSYQLTNSELNILDTKLLSSSTTSLFHDRPVIKNGNLYFVSAHESPDSVFKSWSALYVKSGVDGEESLVTRLTPPGHADFSPALSESGKFVAVASYGSRTWPGEFHDLRTDIVVFPVSEPGKRVVVCEHGGWPSWCGDGTVYFHRECDDGWWSVYRVDSVDLSRPGELGERVVRVTPPGVHCFTPAAMHGSELIAVATRRKGKSYRHIEVFDVRNEMFYPVTELLNPNFHHYNPFVSMEDKVLGYHRFRGESGPGELTVPHLEPVACPVPGLRMLRLNGSFPTFSSNGEFIAVNPDFDSNCGLAIVKSDGSKRWNLLKDRVAFYNSWSPTEENVIYTSLGPIFETAKATVQIARVTFSPSDLIDDDKDNNVEYKDIKADVKMLTREDTGNNAFPSCSPDGKFVVFRSGRTGHKNLYIADAVDGEIKGSIRRLTDGPWIDTMPSWSPDGKLIAFSSNCHNPDNVAAFSIYVIRPDGTDLRRIYVAGPEGSEAANRERINHVCFSADSERLLFTANMGGVTAEPISIPNQFQPYGDLYVVRLDGSGLQRLTWNGYENGTPSWHPDCELNLSRLSLDGVHNGDKLRGQFDEPLWINCDFEN